LCRDHLRGRSAHRGEGQLRHHLHQGPERQDRGHDHGHHLGADPAQARARWRHRLQGSLRQGPRRQLPAAGIGRADAFVMDGAILAGNIAKAKTPADFKIVGEVLSVEPIAIMIRKDDPAFKKVVDDSIIAQMKSGGIAKTWSKWFEQP
ncbi:Uncharacterized protein APZ42_006800, partial [Daphnia magna]